MIFQVVGDHDVDRNVGRMKDVAEGLWGENTDDQKQRNERRDKWKRIIWRWKERTMKDRAAYTLLVQRA